MTFHIEYNQITSQAGDSVNQFAGFYDSDVCSSVPENVIEITKEQHTQFYQDIVSGKNITVNGITIMPVPVIPAQLTWDDIRRKRDGLLAQSDWSDTLSAKTRLGDELYNKWQEYRQALRDLPEKYSDPVHVIWPTPADYGI